MCEVIKGKDLEYEGDKIMIAQVQCSPQFLLNCSERMSGLLSQAVGKENVCNMNHLTK